MSWEQKLLLRYELPKMVATCPLMASSLTEVLTVSTTGMASPAPTPIKPITNQNNTVFTVRTMANIPIAMIISPMLIIKR